MPDSSAKIKRPRIISGWEWFERVSKVLTLAIIPLLLWGIRVELFMSKAPGDAALLRASVIEEVDKRFDGLPPQHFRDEVEDIKILARENNKEIQEMKISLAEIKGDVSAIRLILESG